VAIAKRLFKEKRDAYKKPLYDKKFAKQAPEHGYIQFKNRWVSAADLFNAMYDKEKKKYEMKQTKEQIALIEKSKRKFDSSQVYLSYGYIKHGKKYLSIPAFINAEVRKEKRKFDASIRAKKARIIKKAAKQAQEDVYEAHGYVYAENQWQPASDLLKRRVNNAYAKMMKK
ncbi:MAG: hypothetical protein KAG97_09635, partial [Victivallales bacterium]|nr:hypothetical protein [Victivallales bacterium]